MSDSSYGQRPIGVKLFINIIIIMVYQLPVTEETLFLVPQNGSRYMGVTCTYFIINGPDVRPWSI